MMTAPRPTPTRYDNARIIAIHEAGHAVTHMLLGHHVISVNTHDGNNNGHTTHGKVTYANLGRVGLADAVGTAAGEAAVLQLMRQEQHLYSGILFSASPTSIAAATAETDRKLIATIAADATLPAGIGIALASRILADHWDAVERVADALHRSEDGHLNDPAFQVAADLDGVEYNWSNLSALATEAMPGDASVQSYLTGPGQQAENDRAEYVRYLRAHNILHTPPPALRRQINFEIFYRGSSEIQAALDELRACGRPRDHGLILTPRIPGRIT